MDDFDKVAENVHPMSYVNNISLPNVHMSFSAEAKGYFALYDSISHNAHIVGLGSQLSTLHHVKKELYDSMPTNNRKNTCFVHNLQLQILASMALVRHFSRPGRHLIWVGPLPSEAQVNCHCRIQ
jgi:hypothetical protein